MSVAAVNRQPGAHDKRHSADTDQDTKSRSCGANTPAAPQLIHFSEGAGVVLLEDVPVVEIARFRIIRKFGGEFLLDAGVIEIKAQKVQARAGQQCFKTAGRVPSFLNVENQIVQPIEGKELGRVDNAACRMIGGQRQ